MTEPTAASTQTPEAVARKSTRKINRAKIVNTALKLASEVGLENLSMRMLASELGVSAMTTYSYVRSKDELIELVLDTVVADVSVPACDERGWQHRLRVFADRAWQARLKHSRLMAYALHSSKLSPNQSRIYAEMREMFVDAGLDETDAGRIRDVVRTFLIGSFSVALPAIAMRSRGSASQGSEILQQREGTYHLTLSILIEGLSATYPALGGRPAC